MQIPLLIYNPAAAKGKAARLLPRVQALLGARGLAYDLALTHSAGHAQALSRAAAEAGRPLVLAAGGDGTVNECINGLMQAQLDGKPRPALGVLPVGRGNDFAFGAGLPGELAAACNTLAAGSRRAIDLGRARVDGGAPRFFGNGLGLGFDAVVGFEANRMQRLSGVASYLVGVARAIFLYARAPVYEIDCDGERVQGPFLMVSVMNGRRLAGAFRMAPSADPADGLFDLCLAGQVSQAKIPGIAVLFLRGQQAGHPAIQMTRARRVSVRALEGRIPAHVDGEMLCEAGQSLEIELFPAALEIITPA